MAYEKLRRLGREKFQTIINQLAIGTPPITVARMIHQWGDAQNLREDTLAKQLTRFRGEITAGAFGKEAAEEARNVRMTLPADSTLNCYDEMVALALKQRQRVAETWEKEQKSGVLMPRLNTLIRNYQKLLVATQGMRFDLGFDEYCRIPPPMRISAGTVTHPDEFTKQQRIYEAYAEAAEIFSRLGTPEPSNETTESPGESKQ